MKNNLKFTDFNRLALKSGFIEIPFLFSRFLTILALSSSESGWMDAEGIVSLQFSKNCLPGWKFSAIYFQKFYLI